MSQDTTSYAQALNEAKQVIVQQQIRIKSDAEKIRSQQQQIVDQAVSMSESERRFRDQAAELQQMVQEMAMLGARLDEATVAKQQAEAVVDRQGERVTSLQHTLEDLEKRAADQEIQIDTLTRERETLKASLPTREDEEALSAMVDVLSRRNAAVRRSAMRLADDESGSEQVSDSTAQAEAA